MNELTIVNAWWTKFNLIEKILIKDTTELIMDKNADPDKTEKYKEALCKTVLGRAKKNI